jgi:hypothetical protein
MCGQELRDARDRIWFAEVLGHERVSRLIVRLRGHGLVVKIPRARRYRVTPYGHRVMAAAIAVHDDRCADHYSTAS